MSSRIEDLQRQLEAAYAAIQELDEDLAAGRISAADHADLKAKSERQAAGLVQRLREAERQARPSRKPAAPTGPTLGSRLKGPIGLTVGAVVLVVVGVGVGALLARSSTDQAPMVAAAPPAGMGGGIMPGGPSASAKLEALRREAEPENAPIPTLLAFAHAAMDEGQMAPAITTYKRVLARDPKNVEAITHLGGILFQANHVEQALAKLDEALAIDPDYAHAHWDRAHILFQIQDFAGAARTLEKFLTLIPTGEDADRARALLADARTRAAAAGKATPPAAPAPKKSSRASAPSAG
jgi:tetratricopeptide (TPR) repeat protein